ncbi:MAG: acetylxylan esterase [Planctomycetaceae bacterium]
MPLIRRILFAAFVSFAASLFAADPTPEQRQFQEFVRAQATTMRSPDRTPQSKEEWYKRRETIRRGLEVSWGGFPETPCPLEPKKLGEEQRDGYGFEKLIFQTMPGVWMTAFAYVPDTPGRHAAILQVHGHWKGAKQDPVVQARCIGAAKLGFFVLAVDAFGAGERGLTKNLGEYHGEMVGATLFPIGRPLSGIQVYENMRAVDYLQSRPEVDPKNIGITGASGGGNQSMYAGCYDERIGCTVPCCSVGTYDSYLTTACCMCEVVPNALTFTEEWGVLGLAAPRGLMPINATQDAFQFSVGEALKSVGPAERVFDVMGQPKKLRHAVFDWKHDYSQPMREAMYGWMAWNLRNKGDGSPIPEPVFETFDPETIRCFPNNSRPDDWLTLPQFAAREGRQLMADWPIPKSQAAWSKQSAEIRQTLVEKTFGGFPEKTPLHVRKLPSDEQDVTLLRFEPEPGIQLTARWEHPHADPEATVILLDLNGREAVPNRAGLPPMLERRNLVTIDLRATGRLAWPNDKIGRAPDHNTAQWSLWIGRPLLGQWTWDVQRLLEALESQKDLPLGNVEIYGQGPAGVVALCAAAVDDQHRIQSVTAVNTLSSFISDVPYESQRVGILAPGMLRDVGDISHLAALSQHAQVEIRNPVTSDGTRLSQQQAEQAFAVTRTLTGFASSQPAFLLICTEPVEANRGQ